MGRLLALDYGKKRVGIAVTDNLQLTSNQLTTIPTTDIWNFLEHYFSIENVDAVLIGYPVQTNGTGGSEALRYINPFIESFRKRFPNMAIIQVDERYTSKMAQQVILASGIRKKQRQDKGLVDRVSAAIMLQWYLDYKRNNLI